MKIIPFGTISDSKVWKKNSTRPGREHNRKFNSCFRTRWSWVRYIWSELTGLLPATRPRTVIARFSRFEDRQQTLRNSSKLKNTNICVNEDLCESSLQARKEQLLELRKARAEGKVAYFSHTRLIVKAMRTTRRAEEGDYSPRGELGSGRDSAVSGCWSGGRCRIRDCERYKPRPGTHPVSPLSSRCRGN